MMLKLEIIKLFLMLTIINLIIIQFFEPIKKFFNIFDKPDKIRKFHLKKVSILGGFLIYFNILISCLFLFLFEQKELLFNFSQTKFVIFIFILSLIFILGYYDDKYLIAPNSKLVILTIILLSFVYLNPEFILHKIRFSFLSNEIELKKFSIIFTILCLLLFINAFNMLDGINLQTGFYSLIIIFFFISLNKNLFFLATLFISLIFYLFLNFKNKTFLGDGGTYLLSFVFSLFFINNYNLNLIFADHALIFMLYPGLEIIRLFFFRLIINKHPFSADRNHLHHYLVQKVGYFKTFLVIQFVIIFPIILFLSNFIFFAFFFGISSYFLILFNFRPKNRKVKK